MTPDEWLTKSWPAKKWAPLANRHKRLYLWFDALEASEAPPAPRVEVWPRGGAKTSSVQLAIVRMATSKPLRRKFAIYVCETQEQADQKVADIAEMFEEMGVARKIGKYGNSRGWRRNQLRTADGFNIAALGLDTASRGIKFGDERPDLIIFDDIDSEEDSEKTIAKKEKRITKKIIPAGAPNKAILFIQNLIHPDGIVTQLYERRAKFLHNCDIPEAEPAVIGLEVEKKKLENGKTEYRITGGEATWEGQNLAICERQINEQGYGEFLVESQHELDATTGYFFNHEAFGKVPTLPRGGQGMRFCRAWDLAATQNGGDYTVGALHAWDIETKVEYVVNVVRGQLSSGNVRNLIKATARQDAEKYGSVIYHLAQDPGQAGKDQAEQMQALLSDLKRELEAEGIKGLKVKIEPVTGRKGVRARGWAKQIEDGNACYCEDTMGMGIEVTKTSYTPAETPSAIFVHKDEHRKFTEDETHKFDDQVDASADAHNELAGKRTRSGWSGMKEAHEKATQTNR